LKVGWDIELENKKQFVEVIKHCINMDNEQYQEMRKNRLNSQKIILQIILTQKNI
jgi:hypothetical protein